MKSIRILVLALLAAMTIAAAVAAPAQREYKVVYHITDSSHASTLLVNIRNHLKARPNVRIVVVANGDGVDFLLEGAKNKNGNPYDAAVEEFTMHNNVQFKVCSNTLEARHIDKNQVLPEAAFVQSGIDEVTRLQIEEGYAYVKP
jgi:uncharacterized protein